MRTAPHMVIILLFAVSVSTSWLRSRVNQPPQHVVIEQAYFACDMCGNLRGGIFGKGPTKSFESETARKYIHNWHRIPRAEFKLATERFGIDWAKETPFWSADDEVLAK
jgi:hypothetical protein